MNKIDVGQAIQITANIGVIAGIAFLGFELRQNNELMEAEALATRTTFARSGWGYLIENPEVISLLVQDRNGEQLSAEEEFRLHAMWMQNLHSFEYLYFEDPGSSDRAAGQRRNFATYRSLRDAWNGTGNGSAQAGKDNFDPRFIEWYDENVANVP
jgi:hypothetical protein